VCAATNLIAAAPPNLHTLIELAARLGSSVGLPALPAEAQKLAARRTRLGAAAAHLVKATERKPVNRQQAAVQALGALVKRAEAAWCRCRPSGTLEGMAHGFDREALSADAL